MSEESRLERTYEGEELLAGLLGIAGSRMSVPEVKARFRAAQMQGAEPPEVFPSLFDAEPRFPSPEVAMRLYSNLFGLWDALASGQPEEPVAAQPRPKKEKPAPPVRPAPLEPAAGPLTTEFVESAWRYLEALPAKERQRLRDRFDNTQDELLSYVRDESGLSELGADTADLLLFELWAMLDLARPGQRLPPVMRGELTKPESEAGGEPALDAYIEEALDLAAEEDALPLAESEAIAVLARAAVRSLVRSQKAH